MDEEQNTPELLADAQKNLNDGLVNKTESPIKSMKPDQWDELVTALKSKPSIGQYAMSALAGLGDAISTGVGRSANPGFQQKMMEQQQNQKQNLINALREKYDAGYKGKELILRGQEVGQGQQRIDQDIANQGLQREQAKNQLAATIANQKAEHGLKAQELAQSAAKESREAKQAQSETAQKVVSSAKPWWHLTGTGPTDTALKEARSIQEQSLNNQGAKPSNLPIVKSSTDYAKLPKGTAYQNEKGETGVKN
jgi:hypothetical protein